MITANDERMLAWVLAILGLGALLAGVAALVVGGLLLGPLLVWLAWNVLDLAHAVGAPELGFWGSSSPRSSSRSAWPAGS